MTTAAEIIAVVAEEAGIAPALLSDPHLNRHIAWQRQLAYLLISEHTNLSTTVIGRIMHRDHTTVVDGRRAARERLSLPAYRALHDRIVARLAALEAAE
jgi:chromosomal replication initiation ATPase DnaA